MKIVQFYWAILTRACELVKQYIIGIILDKVVLRDFKNKKTSFQQRTEVCI